MRLGHLDHSLIFNGNHKLYEKTVVISLQFKWINLYFKRIKWMSYMIKKRKGKTSSWFPQTRKKYKVAIFPTAFVCSQCFFRLEGREKNAWSRAPCLFWDHTAILRKMFDRAQAVSCSSLQGLAVEAGQTNEPTEPDLKPGPSLPFSVWSGRISGQSGSGLSIWSVRAQGPGALQLLPGSPATGRREAGLQFPDSVAWT